MENQSLNERNSLTGNSGLLGLTSLRPKLQPIRVKALLEMYGSDEEESEERGKESDSDSDCDDIQPLPDDDEQAPEAQSEPVIQEGDKHFSTTEAKSSSQQFEEHCVRRDESLPPKQEVLEKIQTSKSLQFTNNFNMDEQSQVRLERCKSTSSSAESASVDYYSGSSAPMSLIESHRETNVKFKAPDVLYSSSSKSSYTVVTAKSECTTSSSSNSSHPPARSKFESQESSYFSNERHSHPTNIASQSEPPATSAQESNYYSNERHLHSSNTTQQSEPPANASHLITDTPHKNNPPMGSMRPTPSVSHRSMFQTPQSSKLHHQDYSKNRVQTPATIFGNWSQRHMAQTPMQSRSTILPGDSVRAQAPSILASQHPPGTATSGPTHDTPWYRGTEEKKVRRPLAETLQSSVNHQQHSQSEKPPPSQYSTGDSSVASSDTHQSHGVLESIKEKPSNNSAQMHHLGQHESKENRQPAAALIEKLPTKDEEQGSRGNFEGIKEGFNGNVPNENRSEAPRHRLETKDASASRGVRSNSSAVPNNPAPPAAADQNNVACNKKANVQLSIPSGIRRPNHGETMTVKGKEYLILGSLGEGMSCHVLRVQDLTSLELRAIKVVNLSRMDKDCAQGCLQEISMLHKLQAPCVVKMFDYEIQYPIVHVVMEMGDTDFRSLLNSMTEKKRLPLAMILYYWTEMLTAVKHIHDNGVIHSDLKPANFLLVRGRLKLIDFGIASSMNPDMTSVVKNSPIGTLNYISPEAVMDIGGGGNGSDSPNQNVKYKITFKSDVWSLGCILYSLVYGYTPFHKIRAQWAKIQAITNPNPKISFALPPGNDSEPPPPILIDVLRKCLQHDPKARPTVTQLLQIPYIPTKPNSRAAVPDIPSNIVMKIKHSLTDDEWRQFIEILEAARNRS